MDAQKSSLILALVVCPMVALSSLLDGGLRIAVQVIGVVLVLLFVVVVAARARKAPREDGDDALWLPSRDEDPR